METTQKLGVGAVGGCLVGDGSATEARIALVGRHVIGPMLWHHQLAHISAAWREAGVLEYLECSARADKFNRTQM